jgi:hypothetical protein
LTTTLDLDLAASGQAELFSEGALAESPIALTQPAYELAQELLQLGADAEPVDVPNSFDRSPLTELRRKGVIRIIGGTRGHPGRVNFLVSFSRLVLSQRRRATQAGMAPAMQPTTLTARPTIEELRSLLTTVDELEREMHARLATEIQANIAQLKRELLETQSGSPIEQERFDALSVQMNRLRGLDSEIRIATLDQIVDDGGPLASFVALISSERTSA